MGELHEPLEHPILHVIIIIYKFFRGILLRMHDRSTDGVILLAIKALYKSW